MDQIKIGQFIAKCRKEKNLTQSQLAEKLNITDRAISKWENAKSMPDSSIMIELCKLLDITVNELLLGDKISKEKYLEQAENNFIELKKYIENQNKLQINLSYIFRITSLIVDFVFIFIIFFGTIDTLSEIILIIAFALVSFICLFTSAHIELLTGYYECNKCGNKYVPKKGFFSFSMQIGSKRYLRCPKCHRKSWNKKVLTK